MKKLDLSVYLVCQCVDSGATSRRLNRFLFVCRPTIIQRSELHAALALNKLPVLIFRMVECKSISFPVRVNEQ
jgi:hypothetical protein